MLLLLLWPLALGTIVDAEAAGGETCTQIPARTEEEVELLEISEAASAEVQLLQRNTQLPANHLGSEVTPAAAARTDVAAESRNTSALSRDHNDNVCMLCGRPLPERMAAGTTYTAFRTDCGSRSSPKGPKAEDLTAPAASLFKAEHSNGFCELNFAKSCADAIVNEDYMYWAKSMDMTEASMHDNAQWEAGYCALNGFLKPEIVALQHNFSGMRAKADELCKTKYAVHGIENITFVDMMTWARRDGTHGQHAAGTPSKEAAEKLAAWNCAMGDLGCDMTLCAYSFCQKSENSFGLYGECGDWHPVTGMAVPSNHGAGREPLEARRRIM
jgi:hypothetical protein